MSLVILRTVSYLLQKPTAGEETKTNSKVTAARNRIQEMRLAMKAKMAADKEKMKAEKRHQEVCVRRRFAQSHLFAGSLWSLSRVLILTIQTNARGYVLPLPLGQSVFSSAMGIFPANAI